MSNAVGELDDGGARPTAHGPWVVRCARGLSRVVVEELQLRRLLPPSPEPLVLRQRSHDLLFVPRARRQPTASLVRTAEEILCCSIYGRYKVSKAQLERLARELASRGSAWRLAVSVDGTHFVRQEFRRFLERELAGRGVAIDPGAVETLFAFCVEASYYICVPWSHSTDADGRKLRVAERPGSLPPTIAAAMTFLGRPRPGETVLDPVCGSGTLLAETHACSPEARLIGVDVDPTAVAVARRNLAAMAEARLLCQDSTALDLPARSVHLFLANLPFGKQFGDRRGNPWLYSRLLEQTSRLGVPDAWRAVVLTSDATALRSALAGLPDLELRRAVPIQVRGESATIFVLGPRRTGMLGGAATRGIV